MRDYKDLKERYLQDDISTRLGNLALNLARIKSRCQNVANGKLVADLLQESKLFIEWTAKDTEIEIAAELVELQIQLAYWQYDWKKIWADPEQRRIVSEQSRIWSEKVLQMSGLLIVN